MVKIKKLTCGELNTNCYIAIDNETLDGVLIDPGDQIEVILPFIEGVNVKLVLLTHGHFDHITSCKRLQDLGYEIAIHVEDADKCLNNDLNLSNLYSKYPVDVFTPNILLSGEKSTFNVGSLGITAIHTPGHSAGGCIYLIDNNLFSGDTVFVDGYGRTDFYDGSSQKLRQSIRIINSCLKEGYTLCPGH